MLNHQETEVLIEQLIEVIEERKTGYKKASDKIQDPYLKELFKAHSNFCDVLRTEIKKFSDTPITSSLNGHSIKWKNWQEMKTALKSGERSDLLEACIKGEQRSIYLLQDLLQDPNIIPSFKTVLFKHLENIKQACDLLKIFIICL